MDFRRLHLGEGPAYHWMVVKDAQVFMGGVN